MKWAVIALMGCSPRVLTTAETAQVERELDACIEKAKGIDAGKPERLKAYDNCAADVKGRHR